VTEAIAFVAFMAVVGFLFVRMLRAREAHPDFERTPRKKRTSSREKKLAKLREFEDSIPPRPTIQELILEEARETGVEEIPGGDGLELPVRLKVWHRDEHVRRNCIDGGLRYVVHEGVDPASASEDDVMLMCDDPTDLDVPNGAMTEDTFDDALGS